MKAQRRAQQCLSARENFIIDRLKSYKAILMGIDGEWLECRGNSSNRQLEQGKCPELVSRINIL